MHRSPTLDLIFGGPLTSTVGASIRRAIEDGVPEGQELDWKRDPPHDLAERVAAFANADGGTIIFGVAELGDGSLRANPFDIKDVDSERRKITRSVASRCFPALIPHLITVPDPVDATKAFIAALIPPSPDAPHGVVQPGNEKHPIVYPRRVDSSTIYLTEGLIAAAYRERFSRGDSIRSRLDAVTSIGFEALDGDGALWIYLSLVPERPGRRLLDRVLFGEIDRWTHDPRLTSVRRGGLSSCHVTPDVDRVRLIGQAHQREMRDPDCLIELHPDGSGFSALELVDQRSSDVHHVDQSELIDALIWHIRLLTTHLIETCAASGRATACVGIADSSRSAEWLRPLQFGRPFSPPPQHVRALSGSMHAHRSIDAAACVENPRELVEAVRLTGAALTQAFGLVEPSLVGPGGLVAAELWPDSERAYQWAEGQGIPRAKSGG